MGQAYFAIKTRQKELIEEEEQRRLFLREEMKKHNKHLADAASNAGVKEPRTKRLCDIPKLWLQGFIRWLEQARYSQ